MSKVGELEELYASLRGADETIGILETELRTARAAEGGATAGTRAAREAEAVDKASQLRTETALRQTLQERIEALTREGDTAGTTGGATTVNPVVAPEQTLGDAAKLAKKQAMRGEPAPNYFEKPVTEGGLDMDQLKLSLPSGIKTTRPSDQRAISDSFHFFKSEVNPELTQGDFIKILNGEKGTGGDVLKEYKWAKNSFPLSLGRPYRSPEEILSASYKIQESRAILKGIEKEMKEMTSTNLQKYEKGMFGEDNWNYMGDINKEHNYDKILEDNRILNDAEEVRRADKLPEAGADAADATKVGKAKSRFKKLKYTTGLVAVAGVTAVVLSGDNDATVKDKPPLKFVCGQDDPTTVREVGEWCAQAVYYKDHLPDLPTCSPPQSPPPPPFWGNVSDCSECVSNEMDDNSVFSFVGIKQNPLDYLNAWTTCETDYWINQGKEYATVGIWIIIVLCGFYLTYSAYRVVAQGSFVSILFFWLDFFLIIYLYPLVEIIDKSEKIEDISGGDLLDPALYKPASAFEGLSFIDHCPWIVAVCCILQAVRIWSGGEKEWGPDPRDPSRGGGPDRGPGQHPVERNRGQGGGALGDTKSKKSNKSKKLKKLNIYNKWLIIILVILAIIITYFYKKNKSDLRKKNYLQEIKKERSSRIKKLEEKLEEKVQDIPKENNLLYDSSIVYGGRFV